MCRWVIVFMLNNQILESIRSNFFIFRWIIGSMLNFQNMKSIRGNYLNVSMGHRFYIN